MLAGVGVAELSRSLPQPPDPPEPLASRVGSPVAQDPASFKVGAPPSASAAAAEPAGGVSVEPPHNRQAMAAAVVGRHQTGVWRFLRALGCEPSLADDLTQETFLQLLRQESFVHHSDAATAAYLRRTARNLYISRHRRERRLQVGAVAETVEAVWLDWTSPHDRSDELLSMLNECLQGLTERARLALRMRFKDNAGRAAIGDALGISEHGAKNLMQRAKHQLRECIENKLKSRQD